jgi:hypothetical protein
MSHLDFACPHCDNRRQMAPEALVVICRSCGTLIHIDQSGTWAKGVKIDLDAENPGLPRARFLEKRLADLTGAMEISKRQLEREEWRMYAIEAKSIELALKPGLVPDHQPATQLEWLFGEVSLAELMGFDQTLRGLLDKFKMTARRVKGGQDVAVVKEMYATAVTLYKTLLGNEECPKHLRAEPAETYAKDMVRATLASFERVIGPRAVEALVSGALPRENAGPKPAVCPVCQARVPVPNPPRPRAMCPSCGTVVSL